MSNKKIKKQELLENQFIEEELDLKWDKIKEDITSNNFFDEIADFCVSEIKNKFDNILKNSELEVFVEKVSKNKYSFDKYLRLDSIPLTKDNLEKFIEQYSLSSNYLNYEKVDSFLVDTYLNSFNTYYYAIIEENDLILNLINENFNFLEEYFVDRCIKNNTDLKEIIYEKSYYFDDFYDMVMDFQCFDYFHKDLENIFNEKYILSLLKQNPFYTEIIKNYEEDLIQNDLIKDNILKTIPNDITLLYPLARKLERHFILHIGPTNSGKTYEAIEKLKSSNKGIYLAPLRLMAFENYNKLNSDGIPCTMETGEEILKVEGATHFSKTIELLDINTYYDVAVIDECQMIEDNFRGGAWTRAILGLNSSEIHVCMAPEAKNVIIELIKMCNDSYEIIEHFRKTKLEFDDNLKGFKKGDALILFSKRDVLNCASDLQKKGFKCSILYGMLPYDVRHREVEKFLNEETDILVSTDVIGMGMNLPIKRIVFLRDSKYDGYSNRHLNVQEVKQIAGRAGRFGIYDTGYVTSTYNREFFKKLLNSNIVSIEKVSLSFPENLIKIDGKLSQIITEWKNIVPENIFKKSDINDMLVLCNKIEGFSDDKELLYKFLTILFDVKNEELLNIWFSIFKEFLSTNKIILDNYLIKYRLSSMDLSSLEKLYQKLDLLFNCFRKFGTEDDLVIIMKYKEEVVIHINRILEKQNLVGKKCNYCGKSLKWDYKYGICKKCYENLYSYW